LPRLKGILDRNVAHAKKFIINSESLNMTQDQIKMKHFRKWAEHKNPFLAGVALLIVVFSKPYFELIESTRKGKRIEGDIPIPSVKTWLKLYNNPKRIGKALLNALGEINDGSAEIVDIFKNLLAGANYLQNENPEKIKAELGKISPDEWQEIIKKSHRGNEKILEFFINDVAGETNPKENVDFKKNITTPEFIFFIRVLVPCFSLYGTSPLNLLRQAQNGDDESLEKLIRLDKSIIFEPKISEIIHQAQAMKKQERMSIIKKAFISKPKAKMNMKTIKFHLGGLVSYYSIAMKQKITAADINNLFDAISLDMNGDFDQDIGEMTPEAFAKNIQNAREVWQIILPEEK
jgi:hypothetical protein